MPLAAPLCLCVFSTSVLEMQLIITMLQMLIECWIEPKKNKIKTMEKINYIESNTDKLPQLCFGGETILSLWKPDNV